MKRFLVLLVLLFATPALAQPTGCYPLDVILQRLYTKYQEKPIAIFRNNGIALVLTVNQETGTWTILGQRRPNELCIFGAGDKFNELPDKAPSVDL